MREGGGVEVRRGEAGGRCGGEVRWGEQEVRRWGEVRQAGDAEVR